jgi:hypothetical protein
MPHSICVFCKKKHSGESEEDVLAKWIAREFPRTKGAGWEVIPTDQRKRTIKVSARSGKLGLVSRAPCEKCNCGWMSVIENEAKAVLAPMMKGVHCEMVHKNGNHSRTVTGQSGETIFQATGTTRPLQESDSPSRHLHFSGKAYRRGSCEIWPWRNTHSPVSRLIRIQS